MWDYTEKVKEHYLNPRNVGEVENPDGIGEVGSIKCGDALKLTFKLDENKRVSDMRFKTFGCGSAIASSSVLTEMCKGKTLDEIQKITNKDIADALGGLPPAKMHCSVMGQEALESAILYYRTGGKITQRPEKQGTIICECFSITDFEIEKAIKENNLKTLDEVTHFTKAGGACGNCHGKIQAILDASNGASTATPSTTTRLTVLQKIEKIRKALTEEISPILQNDGGDVELVDVDGNDVYIRFVGHCAGCAFSKATQYSVVQDILRKRVLPGLVVKESQ